ncbi:RNA-binding S4 domain-containing protein [Citricoccus sp.]|uniref:RNA-binding S4 domain-containing protein n=1 Tax=Citricoccus sp. TaxID=1978372 RepID=UPI0028BD5C13|nr:RNA-binding S4 domain-containing protein [Citricoccus sp.]
MSEHPNPETPHRHRRAPEAPSAHPAPLEIRDGMIRLGQALKLANLVEDGADARAVIEAGLVQVNGDPETRRGRQLHPGDVFEFSGEAVKVVPAGG